MPALTEDNSEQPTSQPTEPTTEAWGVRAKSCGLVSEEDHIVGDYLENSGNTLI